MPELADVEGFRRYVSRHGSGRRVVGVRVFDDDVLRNTNPPGLGRAVHGRRLGDPRRRGKWLEVPVDGRWLVFHFGMTGDLHAPGPDNGTHPHDRVLLELDRGRLVYRSQRKLGGVWLARTDGDLDAITGPLGPDADAVDRHTLAGRLQDRRGALKPTLMEQKVIAGIGNELSDEILWQARLDPCLPVPRLRSGDLDRLADSMREVLRVSKRRGRIPDDPDWLHSVRRRSDPDCPRCGRRIRRIRVGGRRTDWCPRCQPRRRR